MYFTEHILTDYSLSRTKKFEKFEFHNITSAPNVLCYSVAILGQNSRWSIQSFDWRVD